MKRGWVLTVFFAGLLASSAFASEKSDQGWNVSAGAGALYSPHYEGDDDYRLLVVPDVRVTYADKFFASIRGVGYNLINDNGWRIGPIAKINFGRDEDGSGPFNVSGNDTDDLMGLGDIDSALELGGFMEYSWDSFAAVMELRQALGGHDGFIGEFWLRHKGRLQLEGPPIIYSFGPRLKFASSDYNQEFFGITPAQSSRSGLSVYQAGAGLVSYGVGLTAIMPLSENLAANFTLSYDRLAEEVEDSPLIQERGSANQAAVGLFLSYEFGSDE